MYSLWTSIFDNIVTILPFVMAYPGIMGGTIVVAQFIQMKDAFEKLIESLSFFIDNWVIFTSIRVTIRRLYGLDRSFDSE